MYDSIQCTIHDFIQCMTGVILTRECLMCVHTMRHTNTQTYVYLYMHMNMYYTSAHDCAHTHTHTHTHAHAHAHTHTHSHTHIHTRIHTQTHKIHTHTHAHTHTHTPVVLIDFIDRKNPAIMRRLKCIAMLSWWHVRILYALEKYCKNTGKCSFFHMILYIYILTFSHPHHTFSQPSHFILAPYTADCHKRMSRRCRMSEMCQHFLTHSHTFYSCTLYHDAPTDIGWRRCVGCLILIGHFPQKSSIISGSFAERDLHLKTSSRHIALHALLYA